MRDAGSAQPTRARGRSAQVAGRRTVRRPGARASGRVGSRASGRRGRRPAARPRRCAPRAPSRRRASASCPAAGPTAAPRRAMPVPTYTAFLRDGELAGARGRCGPGAGRPGSSLRRSPRKSVQAPGAGVQPRTTPVDPQRGRGPVHLGVLDGDLRGEGDALGGLRHGLQACRPRCRPWSRRAARRRRSASRVSRSPLVSVGRTSSVTTP